MNYTVERNIPDLWNYIGSAWHAFENKDVVEAFWYSLASGIDSLMGGIYDAQKSRAFQYMPATLDLSPEWYTITYSGVGVNITEPGDGTFHYELPPHIYYMPHLEGAETTYHEGVDYIISGMNTLIWQSQWPLADYGDTVKLKAPEIKQLNPHLMGVWSNFVEVTLTKHQSYATWGKDQYEHLKYFIWALVYKQNQPPTIKTLTDALGIVHGAPFAFNSGLLTYSWDTDHYDVIIGSDTYVFPVGLQPIPSGVVGQFDILCSGVQVDDYVSNLSLVSQHSNVYNRTSTVVCTLNDSVKNLTYNEELFGQYISGIFPCQFRYIYI